MQHISSIGIDLSLTCTGIVVLENGNMSLKETIKTKPNGPTPTAEIERLHEIIEGIEGHLGEFMPTIAVIEGIAFMARNTSSLAQLAALNYMTRSLVYNYKIPFVIVAPTSLKKFITGSGVAEKGVLMMEVYKRYGVTISDNNVCDAYSLAQVGLALKGGNSKDINKKQEEVLELLRRQLV